MKKLLFFVLICLLGVSLAGCIEKEGSQAPDDAGQTAEMSAGTVEQEEETAAIKSLVEEFGDKLKDVSLPAPAGQLKTSLTEHYGNFVTPALLVAWQNDPQQAPGRMTSSPWPERIEVVSMEQSAEGAYAVQGEVIELTSVEITQGGVAARRPITLTVEKDAERWLISTVTLGSYTDTCETDDTDSEGNPRQTGDEKPDGEYAGKLLLGYTLPFGLSYQEVKAQFPEAGPLQAEGGLQSLEEYGLQEAVLNTEVLGHPTELEFNFEHDKLYSFYYFISLKDEAAAEELYAYLQDYYRAALGAFATEEQEEGGFSSETSYWQTEDFQLGLTHQKNRNGLYFVNWGWCSPAPGK